MIDKWLDEMIQDPEPLDELEQKRILAKIMIQVEQECGERSVVSTTKPRPPRHWKRSAAVACAAVMVLSGGVFGATMLDGGLADFLSGGNEAGREIISEMGTIFEDQSQSVDGYTVTLTQMIHDRNGCYILMNVSRDDDTAMEAGYYGFASSTVGLPDITRSGWYLDHPEAHDGLGETVTMILHYDADEKVAGKTLRLTLKDFGAFDDNGDFMTLEEGEWIFEIPVGKEDHTQTFRLNQDVTFQRGEADKTVTVKTLYLSPMSVTMDVSDNLQSTDRNDLRVILEDGTELEFRGGGYGSGGGGRLFGTHTQVDFQFEHVVDPQRIKEIWYNGTQLEL